MGPAEVFPHEDRALKNPEALGGKAPALVILPDTGQRLEALRSYQAPAHMIFQQRFARLATSAVHFTSVFLVRAARQLCATTGSTPFIEYDVLVLFLCLLRAFG